MTRRIRLFISLAIVVACTAASARAAGWARYQSSHVILYAPSGRDVSRLLSELESAYRDVRLFGIALPGMVEARTYATTADFVAGSGGRAFNLAVARGVRIHLQPGDVLLRRGEMANTLRHELTHVGLEGAARNGLPRWMNEGLAMMVAGEQRPETIRFRRLEALEDTLSRSASYSRLRSAYGTSQRLVRSLSDMIGRPKVLALVRSVASGGNFEKGFRAVAGLAPAEWAAGRLR